jgi:hypothetical protein
MTEAEWLSCTDPQPMLAFLQGRGKTDRRAFRRKLRLFICACCHRVRDLLTADASRKAVEVAERFADGLASVGILAGARLGCRGAEGRRPRVGPEAVAWCSVGENVWVAAPEAASETAWWADAQPAHGGGWLMADSKGTRRWLAALLRDLVFNPFRPTPTISEGVLAWGDRCVAKLAAGIYDERDFGRERMGILADALEEAGVADEAGPGHLRGPGPHARGCWAVDLILARE